MPLCVISNRRRGAAPAGKLDSHEQELWKMPLRAYIEHLYLKRFGKPSPDNTASVEERLRLAQEKKEAQRASKPGDHALEWELP